MDYIAIIRSIDAELARLQEVRKLLAQSGRVPEVKFTAATTKRTSVKKAAKRKLSPEARARIADAQRKRWAAARRASR